MVFGTFPVRAQDSAPMLFKWKHQRNGVKNSDTEASMANPLTSKVVILGRGHSSLSRPAMKSILVLVRVNFKVSRPLNIEFTRKVPVTPVSLRSTSWIQGQVPRTATSPAILVLERCTQRSSVPFNAPRFPVTAVLRRSRRNILVQLAKTAKSPEILVSVKSRCFRPLRSLKLWLKVPLRSLRPLKLIDKTLQMDSNLDRCPTGLFQVQAPQKKMLLSNATLATIVKGFIVDRRVDVYLYLWRCIQNLKWITKVYAVCMCVHYICLIYTTCDSVISELPRYQETPFNFLMSVSSSSLSPRSKSTVRKAASCNWQSFFLHNLVHNVKFRPRPSSMMAEEPLPPKSASTTSFRCKDGRSARPHRGRYVFRPQKLDRRTYNVLKHVFKVMMTLAFWFFQGQNCGMHEPTHPKTAKRNHRHFELQYVLGTPLAANQQPAISTERNATSLHRIENQCASNERFTEVGTLLLWCGPA